MPLSVGSMAIGAITDYSGGEVKAVELLASATATNGVPSGATAGLDLSILQGLFGKMPADVTLLIYSTAGSGTMTGTFRIWGYNEAGSVWTPMGPGADSTKGVINLTAAIGETGADKIRHSETISLIGHFSRLYLEITAIGGTSTAVTGQLVARRGYPS